MYGGLPLVSGVPAHYPSLVVCLGTSSSCLFYASKAESSPTNVRIEKRPASYRKPKPKFLKKTQKLPPEPRPRSPWNPNNTIYFSGILVFFAFLKEFGLGARGVIFVAGRAFRNVRTSLPMSYQTCLPISFHMSLPCPTYQFWPFSSAKGKSCQNAHLGSSEWISRSSLDRPFSWHYSSLKWIGNTEFPGIFRHLPGEGFWGS